MFLSLVVLVERNPEPAGYQMLNTRQVGRHSSSDIIELAREINEADAAIRHTASGKLTLILEQVRVKRIKIKYKSHSKITPYADQIPPIASQKSARRDQHQSPVARGRLQFPQGTAENLPHVPPAIGPIVHEHDVARGVGPCVAARIPGQLSAGARPVVDARRSAGRGDQTECVGSTTVGGHRRRNGRHLVSGH